MSIAPLSLSPSAPGYLRAIPDPEHQISRLPNGLLVCTFPMPWLHEAGATLLVRAGSRFEKPDEAGITHFLEHMLFKGTAAIPDPTRFHTHLEEMAADMNAATGQEHNAYWITLPPEFLESGFSAFCEMFTAPALTGLETERQVIIAEMREDENEQGEIVVPTLLGGEKLWPGHPLARSILGDRHTVAGITEASLQDFLARHFCGINMAMAFFGPLEHQHMVALTAAGLGGVPRGEAPAFTPPDPMPPGPHWVAVDDQTAQLSLALFFRTGGMSAPDHHHLSALRRILDDGFASRLQATLREKRGLVYDLWASYTAYIDTGTLEVGTSVSPDNLLEVFDALFLELAGLIQTPPPPREWLRVTTRWRVDLTTDLDRPSSLMERYVADRLFGTLEPLSETWRRVTTILPDHLPRVARTFFRPENLVVVLVGPQARQRLPELQQRFQSRNPLQQ
ncbi:MAG: insulinase family protein [Magnetococcales bacterium]|nr:insulinase family protein [Magnetococcales bacterium]